MVDAFGDVDMAMNGCDSESGRLEATSGRTLVPFEHGSFTAAHVTAFFTAPEELRSAIVPLRDDYEHRWNALLADVLPELDSARLPIAVSSFLER